MSGTIVRPYGDTTGDGMVQLSFTLPVPADKRAEGAKDVPGIGNTKADRAEAEALGRDTESYVDEEAEE